MKQFFLIVLSLMTCVLFAQDVPFKKDEKLQLFSKKNSLEIGWEKVVQKFNGVNEKSFLFENSS